MEQITKFFWTRWHRACTMDGINRILGKETPNWITAQEWVDAYKQTLSKSKQTQFDKDWEKLEKQLEAHQNNPDSPNPFD